MINYLVAADKPWHNEIFGRRVAGLPGQWKFISKPDELTVSLIEDLSPRYVFFPHWSSVVPSEIVDTTDCVCFHMTDLPYGRGGSPLQNLIVRKHGETKLTALRMTSELDAGPVYLKRDLSLHGAAKDIYRRAAETTWDMIETIIHECPAPQAQSGKPVLFKRRKPQDGDLLNAESIEDIYDYIRMLDAPGYPAAFLRHGGFEYSFSDASFGNEEVSATVRIKKLGGKA